MGGHGTHDPDTVEAPAVALAAAAPGGAPGAVRRSWFVSAALAAILLAAAGAMFGAAVRTSTTFDEIVMIAAGARGYETGDWSMAPEHPPLVQYLYGSLVHLAAPALPDETGVTAEMRSQMRYRYQYAQQFFWREGNNPERIALLGRIPAMLCALALILVVFLYGRTIGGAAAGLSAAAITAVLPDVLAHGAIAYNDVPLALTFVCALWAGDAAIREPGAARGVRAGVAVAMALAIKNSAVALAPIALLLLLWEAVLRRGDRTWLRRVPVMLAAGAAAAYLALVAVYRGDLTLEEYRYGIGFAFSHVTEMRVPAFLLGETGVDGWWYYFPVAFLFKTSAGLHVLMALASLHLTSLAWRNRSRVPTTALRAPLVATAILGALLLTASLNIGFRHAMPVLPLLAILTSCGVTRLWRTASRATRSTIAVASVWAAIHVGSHYPFFISYISEYGPGREEAHYVLADSSLDWGHGLLELRRFMREHDIPAVHLAYFGSALPDGYGIRHAALPSFFPLPPQPPLEAPPEWVAISSTHLSGAYLGRDLYARFREARPHHVVARSIYLYYVGE